VHKIQEMVDQGFTSHSTQGHFVCVLPSQTFGYVLKKLNPTQLEQAIQEQNDLS